MRTTGNTWSEGVRQASARMGSGSLAGLIAGALVGGVGGRIAMFVLRVTSSPALHGLKTDDDFEIGSLTGATVFLVGFTAVLGAIGGVLYVAARRWLPAQRGARLAVTAALAGVVGGAAVIKPGGRDFTELDPLVLAVIMFIAIPAAYGFTVSVLAERFLARESRQAGWLLVLPLVPLLILGPIGLATIAIILLVAAWRRGPADRAWVRSPAVDWAGRIVLAGIGVVAAVALVDDVLTVL